MNETTSGILLGILCGAAMATLVTFSIMRSSALVEGYEREGANIHAQFRAMQEGR